MRPNLRGGPVKTWYDTHRRYSSRCRNLHTAPSQTPRITLDPDGVDWWADKRNEDRIRYRAGWRYTEPRMAEMMLHSIPTFTAWERELRDTAIPIINDLFA